MSQEKVELKKQQKANRKSILRKKKFEYALSMVIVAVVTVAILGWIGYSVYSKAEASAAANREYNFYDVTTDALSDYISDLNSQDSAE